MSVDADLTSNTEVDAAVRALQGTTDPTGGRGVNGAITGKLEGTRTEEREIVGPVS